jgi:NitT/TauT family transport system substrate-binding protein
MSSLAAGRPAGTVSRRRLLSGGAAALVAAGCSPGRAASPKPPGGGPKPEKTDLTVAAVQAVTNTGLYIAAQQGFFTAQGLKVTIAPIVSSTVAIANQIKGQFDVTAGAYESYILAQAHGSGAVAWRILTEGAVSRRGSQAVLVAAGSPVKTVADLRGRTIAANILDNVGTLLIQSMLRAGNVPLSSVRLVAVPFPSMASALRRGEIDAGWFDEPFLTQAQTAIGARVLYDTSQGATADFPISGYMSTRSWFRRYPDTAAAFVRAIRRGQALANTDRAGVNRAVPAFTKVTAATAARMTLDDYPATLDAARVQRVADVMHEFGLLKTAFAMSAMTG